MLTSLSFVDMKSFSDFGSFFEDINDDTTRDTSFSSNNPAYIEFQIARNPHKRKN